MQCNYWGTMIILGAIRMFSLHVLWVGNSFPHLCVILSSSYSSPHCCSLLSSSLISHRLDRHMRCTLCSITDWSRLHPCVLCVFACLCVCVRVMMKYWFTQLTHPVIRLICQYPDQWACLQQVLRDGVVKPPQRSRTPAASGCSQSTCCCCGASFFMTNTYL